MRRALLLLALTVVVASCSDDPAEPTVPAGAPADEVENPEPFGMGSWSAARTVAGKPNELLVLVVGGPEYKAGDPCSVRYEPRVTETPEEVALSFAAFSPKPNGDYGCTDIGFYRRIPVTLRAPLGSRRLRDVQFNRVQPVFDGTRLYEPTWLPDGSKLRSEGSDYDKLAYWTRTYAGESAVADGRCVPGPQALTLQQSAPMQLQPFPAARQVEVRGTTGQIEGREADGKTLSWNEAGQGFQVSATSGCAGDPPTGDDVLFRFAEGLRKP